MELKVYELGGHRAWGSSISLRLESKLGSSLIQVSINHPAEVGLSHQAVDGGEEGVVQGGTQSIRVRAELIDKQMEFLLSYT